MALFKHQVTVPFQRIVSGCLGVDADNGFDKNDIGKLVKPAAAENFILAADGDDIFGQVTSIEPSTYNDGFAFGGVICGFGDRIEVEVGAATVSVGAEVVASTQAAVNTAGAPKVKAGAGTKYKWECRSILSGTGIVGDTILIERI